jgi:hypothetical protein
VAGRSDKDGSVLAAHPGESQGRPETMSSSQLIVSGGLPCHAPPESPRPGTVSLGCAPVDTLERAFHTPTMPSARASTPRSRRSSSAAARSAPSRKRGARSSTGSKPGTTASGGTPGSATAHPRTTNATLKGVTARPERTRRFSLKNKQELPNVYVSTEPGAVQCSRLRRSCRSGRPSYRPDQFLSG